MNLPRFLKPTTLARITTAHTASQLLRLLAAFVVNKALALFVGPAGFALLGNFRDLLAGVQQTAALGLQNGVTAQIATGDQDLEKQRGALSAALVIGLSGSIIIGGVLAIAPSWVGQQVLGTTRYGMHIHVMGISLPLHVLNLILLSAINGAGKYKRYVAIMSASYLMNLGVMLWLVSSYQVNGAIWGLVALPAVQLLITIAVGYKALQTLPKVRWNWPNRAWLSTYGQYALMALVTAIVAPVVYIYVRNTLADQLGDDLAGIWEALNRFSKYYLVILTSLASFYLLPEIAKAVDFKKANATILGYLKLLLPSTLLGMLMVYLLRDWLIEIVYTDEFDLMTDYMDLQLIGDFLKIVAMAFAIQAVARRRTFLYIWTELLSLGSYALLACYLIPKTGLLGSLHAYIYSNTIYLVVFLILHYTRIKKQAYD